MYSFIVNPSAKSGRGEKVWQRVERQLKRLGAEYEVFVTEKPGDAGVFAASLTERCKEPKIIIVVGGDGTVNEVLDGLSFCGQVTLGYIPVSTGGNLAKSLKLPKRPGQCLKKIMNPKYHKLLDYGVASYGEQLEHRRFLGSVGIGVDASGYQDVAASRLTRKFSGIRLEKCCYMMAGLKNLLFAWPTKGYLVLDGVQRVEFNHIYFVSVHMHPFEGCGFKLAPAADPCDGKLTVCVFHNSKKRKLVPLLLRAMLGRKSKGHGIRHYTCQEVEIHMDRPLAVHVDGEECRNQKSIHVRCIPQKVRMIV